ncbi:MAG: PQQ-binding-like beta-propeller repeat protein, partial [Pirellulaceae bacterium]
PWQAALDDAGEPPPFNEVAFQPFDHSKSLPQREDLGEWFEPVPGANLQLHKVSTRRGPCASIEGLGRLRCPWPEDAVLRLALDNYNRLKLHFFCGDRGATLIYHEDQNFRWVAYATTRKAGQPTPDTWAITGSDDDRARRSEVRQGGPIELRYRAGEIVLSRGDIVLTSAPLAGPPTDVFFEGRAVFEGIALVRAAGAPAAFAPSPVALDIARPADLPWKSTNPEIAQPEKLADGGLRFAVDRAKAPVTAYARLPQEGLHEIVLELDDVTPGTGVLLCNEAGQNQYVVRFFRDRRTDQLRATLREADGGWERDFAPLADKPAGVVQPRCWVKLLYGCGTLSWWLSSDGVHWAQPEMPVERAPPQLTHVGLHLVAKRPETQLTLRRVVVRELAGLSALASPELRARGIALPQAAGPGPWLADSLARKPADVATDEWLRACAIRTLGAAAPRELAYPLIEALLDDMLRRDLPLEQQLAALNDALPMCWDLRNGGAMRVGVSQRFVNAGLAHADREEGLAWSSVRHAFHSGPMFTHQLAPLELERPIRAEIIQRAYSAAPADTLEFCRQLRLFDQDRFAPLTDWIESLAARDSPGRPRGEGLTKIKDGWREALLEDLSKETYNTTTELQALLQGEAWLDAARLITSVDAQAAPGVAPYLQDRELLASLPVAVRLTLDDYPQVQEALGDQFAPLAELRVGQAMAAGDAATVEMATVQFAGTQAAAEAHQWLADRALASGWFERAIAEYRRAAAAMPSLAAQVEPRIRLAAAMLGRTEGAPILTPVQFNDLTMSAAEFESLVLEMRARGNTATLSPSAAAGASPPAVPAAKRYDASTLSRLDGPVGEKPQEEVGGRRTNQFRAPWADRQIATVVDGDLLYVSNHFQVAAYNLAGGKRLWQSENPPGPMQRSQDWALIPMRPLVTGSRIFVRLLYSPNPLLVSLDKSSGKIVWIAEAPLGEFFVSDPVIVQGQLGAVTVSIEQQQQGVLRWNTFDPETGELRRQHDLVRLRSAWGKRACCELTPLDDSVVAVLGGISLAFDAAGQVRWVRKHVTIPDEEDPRWVLQMYQRPIVAGGRMYAVQPGVRTVDCLDPLTGREHWSAVLPEVLGIVGLSGHQTDATAQPLRLIVRTEGDIRTLDAATGHTLWRYPAPEAHSFQLAGDAAVLVVLRERKPDQKDQWLTRLVWLDATTGEPTATSLVSKLADGDPRLGPLVPHNDRLITFFGRGQHDPNRDLVELFPVGDADRPTPAGVLDDPWRQRVPVPLREASYAVLPDWQLLSGHDGDRTGLVAEAHGEKGVLGVRSTRAAPVVLGREIALPAMGRPRLRLRLATDAGHRWKLEVRLGQQVLKTEEINDQTHPDRWITIEIDLTPAAGQSGWLTAGLQSEGDHALWLKSAEVIF